MNSLRALLFDGKESFNDQLWIKKPELPAAVELYIYICGSNLHDET
jgi:hypothetical protein